MSSGLSFLTPAAVMSHQSNEVVYRQLEVGARLGREDRNYLVGFKTQKYFGSFSV